MVNAVAPEPQKSLESAQLTPAEAKRVKRIEDAVQPWKQKLTDHHIYDVSFHDPSLRSWYSNDSRSKSQALTIVHLRLYIVKSEDHLLTIMIDTFNDRSLKI